MKRFRLQEREFIGTKQWNAGRYGVRRVNQMGPWKTIGLFDSLYDASIALKKRTTGLFSRRVMYGTVEAIDDRGYVAQEFMHLLKQGGKS